MREVFFVFGSNLAGRHGAGAALEAVKHWGAVYGVGEGISGYSYAIPTKCHNLKTRSLGDIEQSYIRFWKYANRNPNIQFLLTPFGAGLAGYTIPEIRGCMSGGPLRNVWETGDWRAVPDKLLLQS
jgi:hypothetical protein